MIKLRKLLQRLLKCYEEKLGMTLCPPLLSFKMTKKVKKILKMNAVLVDHRRNLIKHARGSISKR